MDQEGEETSFAWCMEAGHIKRMELHSAERGGVLAPLTLEHPNIRESSIGLYLPGGCTSQAGEWGGLFSFRCSHASGRVERPRWGAHGAQARRLALAHGDWEKAQ